MGGRRRIAPPIFTSAQDGSVQIQVPAALTAEKAPPSIKSVGWSVCPRASHNVLHKRKLSCLYWESSPQWAPVWVVLHTNKSGQEFSIIRRRKIVKPPRFHLSCSVMRKWMQSQSSSMIFTLSFKLEVKVPKINRTYQCFSVALYEVYSRYKWRENSRDSAVNIATRLGAGRSGVLIAVEATDFLQNVETCYGAHTFSYSVGTGKRSLRGHKAAGAREWTLTSI